MGAACPPHSRLLVTYTMVLQIEFRVSAASSRTISRIAVLAILQTIALPTELPRREPHFTRKLARGSNVCATNGLDHYVTQLRNGLRDQARAAGNHSRQEPRECASWRVAKTNGGRDHCSEAVTPEPRLVYEIIRGSAARIQRGP